MAIRSQFRAEVVEKLRPLGNIRDRSMFGGVGLYSGDVFFGLLAWEKVFLKVDDTNRDEYVERGMGPFQPWPDRDVTMQYYEVPFEILSDGGQLRSWARVAITIAREAKEHKAKKKVRKSPIEKKAGKTKKKAKKKTKRK